MLQMAILTVAQLERVRVELAWSVALFVTRPWHFVVTTQTSPTSSARSTEGLKPAVFSTMCRSPSWQSSGEPHRISRSRQRSTGGMGHWELRQVHPKRWPRPRLLPDQRRHLEWRKVCGSGGQPARRTAAARLIIARERKRAQHNGSAAATRARAGQTRRGRRIARKGTGGDLTASPSDSFPGNVGVRSKFAGQVGSWWPTFEPPRPTVSPTHSA
jgi:hypothetical protein